MKIETVPIDSIHADPANVRVHPEANLAAIRASLARFGQQKPVVVDARGLVRAGNGTLAAARELGWSEIRIVRSDLAGSEATAFAIADNRTAELAAWDDTGLVETLWALQSEDFDLAAIGFSGEDVDRLCESLGTAILADDKAEPDTPFDDFAASTEDGFVPFRIGIYSGRVSKQVCDSFAAIYQTKRQEGGEVMLDDVLRNWLGI